MAMWGKVARNGKLVKADAIDRGQPLLYTPEVWSRRGKQATDSFLFGMTIVMGGILLPVWLLLVLVIGLWDIFFLIYPPTYCLGMLAVWHISTRYHQARELERENYTALFKNGFQYRFLQNGVHFFIPYSEIESYKVTRTWPYPRLILRLKDKRLPLNLVHAPTILGEEGLRMLEAMRTGMPEPRTDVPPRLFVYGGRAAKVEVLRNNGMEDRLPPVSDVRGLL